MNYSFIDQVNGGRFHLFSGRHIQNQDYYSSPSPVSYYTILFNTGFERNIILDGICYSLPRFGIVPVMFNQSYQLPPSEDLVIWRFNREFYCIVNHDKEVGCAGFLFYGSWGQLILKPDEACQKKLSLLLEVFKDEFEDKDDIQGNMLRMLLVRLIITITRLARSQYLPGGLVEEQKFDLLRQFNLLVENNYRLQHEVKFYAAALFKSPKTLANTFARFQSVSPLQIIHQRIMLEAKRLLNFTEKSIKEIAHELGFEDAAHFTKFFKKQCGVNPTEYKKKLQAVL